MGERGKDKSGRVGLTIGQRRRLRKDDLAEALGIEELGADRTLALPRADTLLDALVAEGVQAVVDDTVLT